MTKLELVAEKLDVETQHIIHMPSEDIVCPLVQIVVEHNTIVASYHTRKGTRFDIVI